MSNTISPIPGLPEGVSVSNIVDAVKCVCTPSAIALYGSRARGNHDVFSDLDVLVITSQAPIKRTYRMLGGVAFDILAGTIEGFCAILNMQLRTNEFEVVFYAALASIPIHDPQQTLGRLKSHAQNIWQNGPRPLSDRELELASSRLLRLLRSAERLTIRAVKDSDYKIAGLVRCDYLVVESVYYYFRTGRRWTTDLPKLVKQVKKENPFIGYLCDKYAEASSLEQRLQRSRDIFMAVTSNDPAVNSRRR